ncbi:MAG: metallopeptidase family protein [Planctomycetes bacterium]|nr:metallopeptidase family protein [Planctomycetota bacterium]
MITVSDAEFDRAVEEALAAVPGEFRPYLDNIVIEVRARPSADLLDEYDVPDDILGLYVGVPLEDQSVQHSGQLPDRILVFRAALCEMCATWDELVEEIRITVLHEIGHHFGLDEDRLERLGYD